MRELGEFYIITVTSFRDGTKTVVGFTTDREKALFAVSCFNKQHEEKFDQEASYEQVEQLHDFVKFSETDYY